MKTIKICTLTLMALFMPLHLLAQSFTEPEMRAIYDEVKTPYKYGMVIAPTDNYHKMDCPTVFRHNGIWLMTYVCYNGKEGNDGRGYETWLAESNDLLHWTTKGRVLSYKDDGWDMNQRGGFPALIDWNWGGSYAIKKFRGNYWMTYIGGHGTGYEAVREPLNIGLAWTADDPSISHEWQSGDKPLLSINDKAAQWWEKLVQYKSNVYEDASRTLGKRFVMFYNAGGINPKSGFKAERIGIALSNDMKHWTRLPLTTSKRKGNPVFYKDVAGIITGDAQIVKMKDKFVMFYFSAFDPSKPYWAFNTFAVSKDLLHWQRWNGDDLIYPSKSYDDMFAHKSCVVKYNGIVYHFYCAVDKDSQRGIAVATSVPLGRSEVHFPTPEPTGKRTELSLNDNWTTWITHANQTLPSEYKGKHTVDLPHNWDDYFGYRQLKHGNLHGTAMYTKQFDCQKEQGKRYFLCFEGIGTYAKVRLNGTSYAKADVGRTTYTLDVTDALRNGNNEIQVQVEHPEMITNMPWVCGGCSAEWGFSEGSQPFGIYRPVKLIATAEQRIEPFGVHVWNNKACDSVFVDTEVKNYSHQAADIVVVNKLNPKLGKALFRLTDSITLQPGEQKIIRQVAAISNAHRWNLDDPYLYTLVSMIKDSKGKTIDQEETETGIRSISWPVHSLKDSLGHPTSRQFLLNGKAIFINGTCDYEHLFGGSHAFSPEQIRSRVKMIRQAGFNAFREAHQPHNLLFQKLFDEQGMLFWSQFSAHIWYDTKAFRESFKKHLIQYIKERRNSPSVILWGLQNESVLPKDFAEECTAIIKQLDPTAIDQRAITTCNGGEGTDWNVIQNWSGTYGGSAANYGNELKRDDQLLNGEYGAWRTLGLHEDSALAASPSHDKHVYSEEAFCHLLGMKARLAEQVKDSVCGHFQWIFVSHENPGRIQPDEALRRIDKVGPINYKGLLTLWEQPTEGYYLYHDLYKGNAADLRTPTAADHNKVSLKGAENYSYLYRVNCGGDAFTDSYGQHWAQDDSLYSHSWASAFGLKAFTASQGHITDNIHGTNDDTIFQYFRWGRQQLYYNFNVPDGYYRVELYFAEPWIGARYGALADGEGERLFDVAINDSTILTDVDPWAEAGYAGALKHIVYAKSKNGQLKISFPKVKAGEAVIAAIAIASTKNLPDMSHAPLMRADYWRSLDTDTIAKFPKELLPKDTEAFPAVRYEEAKAAANAISWTITPGVAREYMLRFRYKNQTNDEIKATLVIKNAQNITLLNRDMTFPATNSKYKIVNTTTDTQINAGAYTVTLQGINGLDFKYLEVQ